MAKYVKFLKVLKLLGSPGEICGLAKHLLRCANVSVPTASFGNAWGAGPWRLRACEKIPARSEGASGRVWQGAEVPIAGSLASSI